MTTTHPDEEDKRAISVHAPDEFEISAIVVDHVFKESLR